MRSVEAGTRLFLILLLLRCFVIDIVVIRVSFSNIRDKVVCRTRTWGDPKIPGIVTKMLSRAASDSLAALDSISVEDFRQCFQHWERCWDCCIQSQGEYFEGD